MNLFKFSVDGILPVSIAIHRVDLKSMINVAGNEFAKLIFRGFLVRHGSEGASVRAYHVVRDFLYPSKIGVGAKAGSVNIIDQEKRALQAERVSVNPRIVAVGPSYFY